MRTKKFNLWDKEITISYIGKTLKWDKQHDTFKVNISFMEKFNKTDKIEFMFYDSIMNTDIRNKEFKLKDNFDCLDSVYKFNMKLKKINQELIYSILCCIESDYNFYCCDEWEFFSEYGYEPSEENKLLFMECKKQKKKLDLMFNDEEILKLNENDDVLKETIKNDLKEVF